MIFLFFVLLVVLLATAFFIHQGFKYTRMIGNIFLSLVYKPAVEPSSSSFGEKVTILDSADKEIEALFIEQKGAAQLAIFCHESGSSKESWEKYAYFLPALGFHILSVDFRNGGGDTAGQNTLSQWPTREDVGKLLKVIHWSKKALRPDLRIVLFGVSNGADIAFAASFLDPDVKGVVADGLFSMKEIFRDYIRKWAPILVKPNLFGECYPDWVVNIFTALGLWYSQKKAGKQFVDVERLLRRKHPPLLMVHGGEDEYVPGTHQRLLEGIDSAKERLGRLVVAGAGHNEAVAVARQAYEKKVTEFLGKLS